MPLYTEKHLHLHKSLHSSLPLVTPIPLEKYPDRNVLNASIYYSHLRSILRRDSPSPGDKNKQCKIK